MPFSPRRHSVDFDATCERDRRTDCDTTATCQEAASAKQGLLGRASMNALVADTSTFISNTQGRFGSASCTTFSPPCPNPHPDATMTLRLRCSPSKCLRALAPPCGTHTMQLMRLFHSTRVFVNAESHPEGVMFMH